MAAPFDASGRGCYTVCRLNDAQVHPTQLPMILRQHNYVKQEKTINGNTSDNFNIITTNRAC